MIKDLVVAGINNYWEKKLKPNLWWIIPSLLLALAAFVAAEVLTGGAITAALPVIMEVVMVLFVAHDISRVVGGLQTYLDKGWTGDIQGRCHGFAKGIAAGVVAALMFFMFEYGGQALKAALKVSAAVGGKDRRRRRGVQGHRRGQPVRRQIRR